MSGNISQSLQGISSCNYLLLLPQHRWGRKRWIVLYYGHHHHHHHHHHHYHHHHHHHADWFIEIKVLATNINIVQILSTCPFKMLNQLGVKDNRLECLSCTRSRSRRLPASRPFWTAVDELVAELYCGPLPCCQLPLPSFPSGPQFFFANFFLPKSIPQNFWRSLWRFQL